MNYFSERYLCYRLLVFEQPEAPEDASSGNSRGRELSELPEKSRRARAESSFLMGTVVAVNFDWKVRREGHKMKMRSYARCGQKKTSRNDKVTNTEQTTLVGGDQHLITICPTGSVKICGRRYHDPTTLHVE
jgi:hypothetical protein